MTTKNLLISISLATAIALTGCSSKDDSNTTTTPPEATTTETVSGSVVANDVYNATVRIYDICSNHMLASTTTDDKGAFSFDVDLNSKKIYKIVASGGTYTSEASLQSEDNGDLTGILSLASNGRTVSITALTTMMASRLDVLAGSCSDINSSNVDEAAGYIARAYGLDDPKMLLTLRPALTNTAGDASFKYAFVLGVLEELALHLDTRPKELYRALAEDIADGKFDGKKGVAKVELRPGIALPATAGVADTIAATFKFVESNRSALIALDINSSLLSDLSRSLVEDIASAPVADSSSGTDITNSGAITSVSSKGKQLLFVAGRNNGLIGIDITNPDENLTKIDLTNLNTALSGLGLSNIGGVIAVPGTQRALVYSYGSTTVALVDVSVEGNESIISSSEINISKQQSFSGGSAYISSGLPQVGVNGIWLATADGYKLLDVSTLNIVKEIPLANNQIIAENIGGSINGAMPMLFSPNYGAGFGGGLQIVDLNKSEAYSMEDNNFSSYIGVYPSMGSADAGSVDSIYNIGIITPEDASTVALVKLDELTYNDNNTSDNTDNTFTVENNKSVIGVNLAPNSYVTVSGVYTDSSSHLALFMAGYSSDIVVGRLQDPSDENWTGLSEWNYSRGQYSYSRDPHAGAVIKSLSTGKAYGYLLDNSGAVIQVDMQAFLDANATDHHVNVDLYDINVLKKID